MSDDLQQELPASLAALIEEAPAEEKPADPPVEQEQPDTAPVDPVVDKASKGGWTDKDAWVAAGKDPDEWVDAKEFVSRKPLYDKLHKQAKALKEKDEKLEAVSKYAAKANEAGYKRALDELKAERREAIQLGDVDAVEAVDKKIDEVKKDFAAPVEPKPDVEPAIPDDVKAFADKNKWFEKDEDMTDYALMRAQKYGAQGMPRSEFLPLVEADVKRAFAHKFVNPNKDKPAAVISNNRESRPKTFGYNDLNTDQKQVWSVLKNSGMKLDKFIKDLVETGDLK